MDMSCSKAAGLYNYSFLITSTQASRPAPRFYRPRNVFIAALPDRNQDRPRKAGNGGQQRQPSGKRPLPPLPKISRLVVVEGYNDMKAVRRAVNADVFVLGTATHAAYDRIFNELEKAAAKYDGVVILTDPDVAGRQARNLLDTKLQGCWHAFVPVPAATAQAAVRTKEEGDIGIEHAKPQAILQALKAATKSVPERNFYTRESLIGLGLINPMHEMGGQVTKRRALLCEYLGLGMCDGKQLLRQLNRYDFTEERVLEAKAWADQQLLDNESE